MLSITIGALLTLLDGSRFLLCFLFLPWLSFNSSFLVLLLFFVCIFFFPAESFGRLWKTGGEVKFSSTFSFISFLLRSSVVS